MTSLDDSVIVPYTQPSPKSFGTQIVNKFNIRSLANERAEATSSNNSYNVSIAL